MSSFDDFPVSEMAKNRALRTAEEAAAPKDPVEKLIMLIGSATTVLDHRKALEEYAHLQPDESMIGEILAVKALLGAGVTIGDEHVQALQERIKANSLQLDSLLEATAAADGTDIRKLYLAEDGGNG